MINKQAFRQSHFWLVLAMPPFENVFRFVVLDGAVAAPCNPKSAIGGLMPRPGQGRRSLPVISDVDGWVLRGGLL